MTNLLHVINLKTQYNTIHGPVKAVDGVNFEVEEGDALGLAGESGCGKTTVAMSIMKLLPWTATISDGQILFKGTDLVKTDESKMRKIRWSRISIVFQGAMNALNPVKTVGDQVAEPIIMKEGRTKEDGLRRAEELLGLVGISASRLRDYPHEFSGGMRQRAMIAMALACNPDLVIADEPVTALDVMTQAQILQLIKNLRKQLGLSMILITHDLSVVSEICNKTAIMYAGNMVELAATEKVLESPDHPYTQALIKAFPSLTGPLKTLESIPGNPPNLLNPPPGCKFYPRCPLAMQRCKDEQPLMEPRANGHLVACHYHN